MNNKENTLEKGDLVCKKDNRESYGVVIEVMTTFHSRNCIKCYFQDSARTWIHISKDILKVTRSKKGELVYREVGEYGKLGKAWIE